MNEDSPGAWHPKRVCEESAKDAKKGSRKDRKVMTHAKAQRAQRNLNLKYFILSSYVIRCDFVHVNIFLKSFVMTARFAFMFVFCLALFSSRQAVAQELQRDSSGFALGFIYMPSFVQSDLGALSSALDSAGYGTLDDRDYATGIGVMFGSTDRLFGILHYYFAKQKYNGISGIHRELYSLISNFSLGYDLLRKESLQFAPLVGYSMQYMNLGLWQPVSGQTFIGYLSSGPDQKEISTRLIHAIDATLQFNWLPVLHRDENVHICSGSETSRLILGVNAGYSLALSRTRWATGYDGDPKAYRVDLTGGPDVSPGGLHAGISIGFLFH